MPELRDVFAGEPEPPDEPGYTEEETTVGEVLPPEFQKLVDPLTLKIPIIKREYKITERDGSVSLKKDDDYELILRPPVEDSNVPDYERPIATEYIYLFEDGQLKGGQIYTYMADGVTIIHGDF